IDALRECLHVVNRLVLIDRKHFAAHGSRERQRIRLGAQEERHTVHASLRKRYVNLRRNLVRYALLANVADHTNNRAAQTFRLLTTKTDTLPEWVTIRGEALRKRLVDDCDFLPVRAVARVVVTTAQQRYLQRAEIVGRHCADTNRRILLLVDL